MGPQLLSVVLAMLEVRSTVACPDRADVAARLEPLLPRDRGGGGQLADVAEISASAVDGQTTVRLARPDGTTIAQRALPADEPCAAQAQIAAVMIATWEGRLWARRSDGALALPEPRPAGAMVLATPAPPPPAAPRWRGELAAGPLAALGQGELGMAAGLDAAAFAPGSRWGLGVALVGIGDRQASFVGQPGASYTWRRLELGVGPALALRGARWSLAVRGAVVAGVVDVRGAGFAVNQGTTSVDVGGAGTLRLGYRVGALTPWVGVTGIAWAREQVVRATFVNGQERLPRYEALAGVGVSWEALF